MNRKLFACLLFVSFAVISTNASAFDRMGSIGSFVGYSQHSFELDGYEPVNTSDFTLSINIGWDVSDRISLDGAFFYLGDYEFRNSQPENNEERNPKGSITGVGLAALFYLAGSHGLEGIRTRQGFNLYAKLGGSLFMGDFYFGSIDILQDITDGERLTLGLGIEYTTSPSDFALKAELNTYNDDLLVGSLSLLWRWGRN